MRGDNGKSTPKLGYNFLSSLKSNKLFINEIVKIINISMNNAG